MAVLTILVLSATYLSWTFAQSTDCVTPNGENAQCIPVRQCEIFIKALPKANDATKDFMRKSQCGPHYSVCCGTATGYWDNINPAVPTTPLTNSWRPLASRKICGYQHTDDRFYTGNSTAIDEFPWMAQLLYKDRTGKILDKCAGALISRRYVLTAAHCVIANSQATLHSVRLGEYDRTNDTDCVENPAFPECSDALVNVDIEKYIVHPNYASPVLNNDIALIRLVRNIQFTDFVRPICLPSVGFSNVTIGQKLTFSGWGIVPTNGRPSRIKKRILNEVVSNNKCVELFKKYSARITIDDTVVCTSENEDQAVCKGDSGGPGMTKHGLQWQQDGIVSFGPTKCGASLSGNVKVSKYMDWIINTIEP